MTPSTERARHLRDIVAALTLVAIVCGVAFSSTIAAQARAAIVVADALDLVDGDHPLAAAVTQEPNQHEAWVADAPATIISPAGEGPWPTVVFISGASREGRHHPNVVALGSGLARAGHMAILVDLEGLREWTVGPDTVDQATRVIAAASMRDDVAGGQVSLASVSVGASIALLAASQAHVADRVSTIAGVAPYADLSAVTRLAVTGTYRRLDGERERFEPGPFLKVVVATSLVALLAEDERPLLEAALRGISVDEDPAPRLAAIEPSDLSLDAQALVRLLTADSDDAFDIAYADLPDSVRYTMNDLSPVRHVDSLGASVHLISARADDYFPIDESRRIIDASPRATFVVSDMLAHAIPEPDLAGVGDAARFNAFVVRFVRDAR